MVSTQLMSRLSPCSTLSPQQPDDIPAVWGVFLHQMVKGWTDEEVFLTANLIFNTFNSGGSKGSVSVVMEPSYHLGPRPEIEIHIRNFLYSAFWPLNRRGCGWRLLIHVSPMRDISTMRVLLLISSLDRSTICSLVSSGLTIWMPFLLLM